MYKPKHLFCSVEMEMYLGYTRAQKCIWDTLINLWGLVSTIVDAMAGLVSTIIDATAGLASTIADAINIGLL